ncbi:hypothetical protein Gotur_008493 [Gossypium turneri]
MKRLLRVIVLLMLKTLITKLLLKFWVLKELKAEAAAREAEQSRKYNALQLQLQNMIKMFQQSQNLPS